MIDNEKILKELSNRYKKTGNLLLLTSSTIDKLIDNIDAEYLQELDLESIYMQFIDGLTKYVESNEILIEKMLSTSNLFLNRLQKKT